jgi:hypothetical protein
LQCTPKYASFLGISHALHLDVFDRPGVKLLFQQPDREYNCGYGMYLPRKKKKINEQTMSFIDMA